MMHRGCCNVFGKLQLHSRSKGRRKRGFAKPLQRLEEPPVQFLLSMAASLNPHRATPQIACAQILRSAKHANVRVFYFEFVGTKIELSVLSRTQFLIPFPNPGLQPWKTDRVWPL